MRALVIAAMILAGSRAAAAQNALTITEIKVDRPTLHAAGIQVLISGDDNRDATIGVRYTESPPSATSVTRDALPLFRVFPETVTGRTVPAQFAGTIFDLDPGHTYDVDLMIVDPDGGTETRRVTVTTRSVPSDPPAATPKTVATATALRAALQTAQPGDVITIADGVYTGSFTLTASGTPAAPIVIRGLNQTSAILDGMNCDCNVLEIYGSHVHVERLTIRNAVRGMRFLGTGTTANAVTAVRIMNVQHGIGSDVDQTDFTLCDNVVLGRLAWPLISSDDGDLHADDQGIRVDGSGHIVCHNEIAGFGDPLINVADGGRAYDFYGNDIHEIYGDGTELDRGEGNVRLFHNRFTNVFTAVSIQPAYGGPTYVLRNQVVNVADEQLKLKSVGGTTEPSGVLIYHNTFVSPQLALNLQTPITQHNFEIANNLFIGPETTANGRTVDWTAAIDRGEFEGNGYYPDDGYWFGTVGSPRVYANLAAAQAAGVETTGRVLVQPVFSPSTTPPASYTTKVTRDWLVLAESSNAIDAGRVLPGINTNHLGDGPDLGASERGCNEPAYGPRTPGARFVTNKVDCAVLAPPPRVDGPFGGDDSTGSGDGGCCQSSARPDANLVFAVVVMFGLARRRRSYLVTEEMTGCGRPRRAEREARGRGAPGGNARPSNEAIGDGSAAPTGQIPL